MNKVKRGLFLLISIGLLFSGKPVTAAGYLHWEQQLAFLTLRLPKPDKSKAVGSTDLVETTPSVDEATSQPESAPDTTGSQETQMVESAPVNAEEAVTEEAMELPKAIEATKESEKDGEADEETKTSGEVFVGNPQ